MASMALALGVPVAVAITGTHSFLLALTKDEEGRIPFSSTSVVLLQETAKLLIAVLFSCTNRGWSLSTSDWVYLVPSLCYALNNNAAILLQRHMDSATFQVLCNFKTVTTVLCFYLLLRRTFSARKWLALLLLFISGVLNTLSSFQMHERAWDPSVLFITPFGVVGMLLYCLNSGFASVYSELIMKRNPEPFFVQSIKMYLGGVLINAALALVARYHDEKMMRDRPWPTGFLHGFSTTTWVIVGTQAINGVIYGYVIKSASNILRLFIVAVSMLLATATATIVFEARLSPFFVLSLLGVLAAVILFNTSSNTASSQHHHRHQYNPAKPGPPQPLHLHPSDGRNRSDVRLV